MGWGLYQQTFTHTLRMQSDEPLKVKRDTWKCRVNQATETFDAIRKIPCGRGELYYTITETRDCDQKG